MRQILFSLYHLCKKLFQLSCSRPPGRHGQIQLLHNRLFHPQGSTIYSQFLFRKRSQSFPRNYSPESGRKTCWNLYPPPKVAYLTYCFLPSIISILPILMSSILLLKCPVHRPARMLLFLLANPSWPHPAQPWFRQNLELP